MTTEGFYTYQEQLFDAFSKRVIKNLGIDLFHEMDLRREKEVSLSFLPQRDLITLCAVDTYHLKRSGTLFFAGEKDRFWCPEWGREQSGIWYER